MIEACLDSLDWVDEIVVLDSGSTDRTVELATRRGAKVYVSEDWQGYGIQRQRAQGFATSDYIFAIDADERVSPKLRQSIEHVLARPDDSKVYKVVMSEQFLGKFLDLHGWYHRTHARLYARRRYAFNSNLVHESLETGSAATKTLAGPLWHYTCRDYQYFLEKHVSYAHSWARERASLGQRSSLTAALAHAIWTFVRTFVFQGGFLDGRYGFLFAAHCSHYAFNKHAALWYYAESPPSNDCRGRPQDG